MSEDRFAASAREYVESLHQNSRTHLLYGKNNVLVQPVHLTDTLLFLPHHPLEWFQILHSLTAQTYSDNTCTLVKAHISVQSDIGSYSFPNKPLRVCLHFDQTLIHQKNNLICYVFFWFIQAESLDIFLSVTRTRVHLGLAATSSNIDARSDWPAVWARKSAALWTFSLQDWFCVAQLILSHSSNTRRHYVKYCNVISKIISANTARQLDFTFHAHMEPWKHARTHISSLIRRKCWWNRWKEIKK